MSILRPVAAGRVTQDFDGAFYMEAPGYIQYLKTAARGRRRAFTGGRYRKDLHLAIDYGVAQGTPVRAVHDGVIVSQGVDSTGGAFIYLRVRRGLRYQVVAFYYHLKVGTFRFRTGASVKRGQVLALSGNSGGKSTGAHLHFELLHGARWRSMLWLFRYGMRRDPQPFIDGKALSLIA